jgi:hypothetical protein
MAPISDELVYGPRVDRREREDESHRQPGDGSYDRFMHPAVSFGQAFTGARPGAAPSEPDGTSSSAVTRA